MSLAKTVLGSFLQISLTFPEKVSELFQVFREFVPLENIQIHFHILLSCRRWTTKVSLRLCSEVFHQILIKIIKYFRLLKYLIFNI